MHLCDNAPCVNPAHLQLATQRDNIRDAHAKGRAIPFSSWPGVPKSAVHRARISEGLSGLAKSETHRASLSKSAIAREQRKREAV